MGSVCHMCGPRGHRCYAAGVGLHVSHSPACLHMSGGFGDINTDRGTGKHRPVHWEGPLPDISEQTANCTAALHKMDLTIVKKVRGRKFLSNVVTVTKSAVLQWDVCVDVEHIHPYTHTPRYPPHHPEWQAYRPPTGRWYTKHSECVIFQSFVLPLLGANMRSSGAVMRDPAGSVKERVPLSHRPERTGSGQRKYSIKHRGKKEDPIRFLGAPRQSGLCYFIKILKPELAIMFQLSPQQVSNEALVPVMISARWQGVLEPPFHLLLVSYV